MTTALKFMFSAALAIALSACSKETSEKKVDDMNAKIARMNAIQTSLRSEGVYVGASSYSSLSGIRSGLSNDKVAFIRSLLTEYVTLGDQVLLKTNDKDVLFSDTVKLKTNVASARAYLKDLEGYEERSVLKKRDRDAVREREAALERERLRDRDGSQARHEEALRESEKEILKLANGIRDIKIKHFVNVSTILNDSQYELKNNNDLRSLRDETRDLLVTANMAIYRQSQIDLSKVADVNSQRELSRDLKTYASNIEANLRRMNYVLAERTGERRTDFDGARTRTK